MSRQGGKGEGSSQVIVGGLLDGRKTVLVMEPGYRESTESRSGVLRKMKERRMNRPRCVIRDLNDGAEVACMK